MNREQIWTASRSLLQVVLGVAIGRGWLTAEDSHTIISNLDIIVPALASLAIAIYGVWKRRELGLAQSAGQVKGLVVATTIDASPTLKAAAADDTTPANAGIVPVKDLAS